MERSEDAKLQKLENIKITIYLYGENSVRGGSIVCRNKNHIVLRKHCPLPTIMSVLRHHLV